MSEIKEPLLGRRFKYNSDFKNPEMSSLALGSLHRVRRKIKDGTYKFEFQLCYCGSEDSVLLAEMDRYGNYYPFVICRRCGIMRANPRLTNESYIDFYTNEYRTLYGDSDRDKEELYLSRVKQSKEVFDFITDHIKLPPNAVVFDIGCNMGTMLLPFYENGCHVMGVDYGVEYIEYGKKKTGLNLEIGGVERLREFSKKADLILLNHVFEHFLDLDMELKQIREVMKPDAYLYVSVPGIFWWVENICGGDIMGLLQNAHTWQFSLETLKYVMQCNRFELVFGNEKILSIFKNSSIKRNRDEVPRGEFRKVVTYLEHLEKRYLPKYFLTKIVEPMSLKKPFIKVKNKFFRKEQIFL